MVEASRKFVCVRLATYENQAEADFTKTIHLGKSGFVENSTFGILSPDGKQKLTRAGRAPFYEYRNAHAMAEGMKKIAAEHKVANETVYSDPQLPYIASLDLAINVSSADKLPLVVVVGNDPAKTKELEAKLLPLAWSHTFAGQFNYVTADKADDFKPVTGIEGDPESMNSVLILEPGKFGLSGDVLAELDASASTEEIQAALSKAVATMERPRKSRRAHVNMGMKLGVMWESKTPVTDPEAAAMVAKRRNKK